MASLIDPLRSALVLCLVSVLPFACSDPEPSKQDSAGQGGSPAGGSSSFGGAGNAASGLGGGGSFAAGGIGGASAAGGSQSSGGASAAGGSGFGIGGTGEGGAATTGGAGSTGDAGRVGDGGSSGGSSGTGGAGASAGSGGAATASAPCDIYASGDTPCVAAHSTVRALYAAYDGNLYQVRRADNTTKDIGVLAAGGFADAAAQDTFCAGTTCVITILYDQSGNGNDLLYQGPGGAGGQDQPATATSESLMVSGHKIYALYINPRNSYWHDGSSSGIPTGSAPEGMYMVTSGTHVNDGCCFDYGNSETNRKVGGAGAMDAINFSKQCWFGGCAGSGPWVQADLEGGLYQQGSSTGKPDNTGISSKYVTAMLKNNGTSAFALKGSNAQSGDLTTFYDGRLPPGYSPMHKQGAIVLGSGGDCCATNTNLSLGTFYEGAIVSGYPSDTIDGAIQDAIVAAEYGH